MSQYIHQVPGRIRVRSKALRCRSERARAVQRALARMNGVHAVRVNPHAGSITIHYDTNLLHQSDLLAVLQQANCMTAESRPSTGTHQIVDAFGKAVVGAVMQKAVEQSARTLVGALI